MCGIIAVLGRTSARQAPSPEEVEAAYGELVSNLEQIDSSSPATGISKSISKSIASAKKLDDLLKGVPGTASLIDNPDLKRKLDTEKLDRILKEKNQFGSNIFSAEGHIQLLTDIRLLKDIIFSIKSDRLDFAQKVEDLLLEGSSQNSWSDSAVSAMVYVQVALTGLDNIEVRGRDSAGIQILLYGGSLEEPKLFVYKVASETGKLGDNTSSLKHQIQKDRELFETLGQNTQIQISILAHTRWASVGLISLANAHPLDSTSSEEGENTLPQVSAVINGDIDNYLELIEKYDLKIPGSVTTDSKVLPLLTASYIKNEDTRTAFLKAVQELKGSNAIAASSTLNPSEMHLSLFGSGQGLYVGLGEDMFLVVSEPYGLMSITDRYLRMEDEVIHLLADQAGELGGISRHSRSGDALPVSEEDLVKPEISTRDIARGNHPHFFIKEIYEAPDSVRKTIVSRVSLKDGKYEVVADGEAITEPVRDLLTSGSLEKIYVIGQGTAGVAARAVAAAIRDQLVLKKVGRQISVEGILSSELSSAVLDESRDMGNTLVVAVSQSGTTTDTNRTVELVRSRGAVVVSIVNRRSSDLVDRSDGVFYTSDGRDVEMSVASTKAFYSQAVAGLLLAFVISDVINPVGSKDDSDRQKILKSLADLPEAMEKVLESRHHISEIATRVAPSRRWWAVVGSGRDLISAEEVRIKLSELCYKSIAQDSIEDKKHIDLSSEPMILVCAAGLSRVVAQDMAKEVAIYRAHKAAPVIFTDEHTVQLFTGMDAVALPIIDSRAAFILSALAGHLFSYEAALAIDAGAMPLRETRELIEKALDDKAGDDKAEQEVSGEEMFQELSPLIVPHARKFEDNLRRGEYDGHLQVSTAARLANLYRYATNTAGLNSYQLDFGTVGTPAQVLDDLTIELGKAIDELYRPIDAIRHQAKTVTVGISRVDEAFLTVPLVAEVMKAGAPRDQLSYETLKMLAGLDPVVEETVGYIRYLIQGDENLTILDRSGEGAQLKSRVEALPVLLGTKHRVTTEQKVLITRGRMDGRTVIIVPEVKNSVPVGLTLLHIKAREFLPADLAGEVMKTYKGRYEILRDAVMETELEFDEALLGEIPIMDLLDQPIAYLADKWSKNGEAK